jgi:hypothetical protein
MRNMYRSNASSERPRSFKESVLPEKIKLFHIII